MTEPNFPRLSRWMTDQLAARDWGVTDLANASGLNRSGIQRWKAGTLRPDVDNARRLADAFGRPLLEVLVVADILTEEEAKLRTTTADPAALSNEQILVELSRRLDASGLPAVPTADEIAAAPERYKPVGRRKRTGTDHVRSVEAT
jgi:transcriptional regulator with XRE-family HTH domain